MGKQLATLSMSQKGEVVKEHGAPSTGSGEVDYDPSSRITKLRLK
jgi:hypothetical protein